MKYTILELGKNSKVKFEHDDGSTSTQTIANLPLNSKDALEDALLAYENAYMLGVKQEEQAPAEEIVSIVNKPQTILIAK